nr:MAG TPA: hypothetical protein [Caudoviricetes sp.]
MKKISGYDKIQESGSFKKLPVGGYVVKILNATDVSDKEYLRLSFDIAEGPNKGFFAEEYKNDTREDKKWPNAGTFVRSYKEKALPMMKGFTTAVEKSNKNYTWNFDESTLKGKLVGLVIGEEEFVNSSGKVRTRTYVNAVRSVDVIREGKFEVPELKKLSADKVVASAPAASQPFKNPFDNDDAAQFDSAPVAVNENPWGDSDENPFA